jgi:hypothetical protein
MATSISATYIVLVVAGAIIWLAISLFIIKNIFKGNSLMSSVDPENKKAKAYKENEKLKKKKSATKKR